jgi:hypothetical protein
MDQALSSIGRPVILIGLVSFCGLACTSGKADQQGDPDASLTADDADPACKGTPSVDGECFVSALSCSTSNPCPVDDSIMLATVCGLNIWGVHVAATQDNTACYFDMATGALRTFVQSTFSSVNPVCSNFGRGTWFGPKPLGCDLSSPSDVRRMTCPRTVLPPPCPAFQQGDKCYLPAGTECTAGENFYCTCGPVPPNDNNVWHC